MVQQKLMVPTRMCYKNHYKVLTGMLILVSLLGNTCAISNPHVAVSKSRSLINRKIIYIVNMNNSSLSVASAQRIAVAVKKQFKVSVIVEHYRKATYVRVTKLRPAGIILSGQSSPWETYSMQYLEPTMDMVRRTNIPILGICGGHQFIALTYKGKVDRIKRQRSGKGYDGCFREKGFVVVKSKSNNWLLGPANTALTVYESHCDEIKTVPDQFVVTAYNSTCKVQAMAHRTRQVYGLQFHPEISSKAKGDGDKIMSRFLRLCLGRIEAKTAAQKHIP